ncbi:MAG TPA: hypothetical protein VMB50_15440 [Myxococcales bacterium]|nr:hypothetical protein [Myxococcales bacterium]
MSVRALPRSPHGPAPEFASYKLALPGVDLHVRRVDLQRRLDEARARAPLTWVMGLPGSGKTSAVAAWVRESAVPHVWYRLDETDAHVAGLFAALASTSDLHDRLPVWSPAHGADLVDFARRFFAELGARPLTIVLDDCHRVPDDSGLMTLLSAAHEVCGETLRFFILSRRAPPPRLARGSLHGRLSLVDDLRLTKEEARAIARSLDASLSEAQLKAADGWLAAILAAARSHAKAALPGTAVGDFLADELLAALPSAAHRAALRHLAELPEIPRLKQDREILPAEVEGLLDALAAQRAFVDAVSAERWRLHDLLRDALLAHVAREDGGDARREVRRRLAAWARPVLPEAALQLASLAGDGDAVLDLLEDHGQGWLSAGLHRSLDSALARLPDAGDARLMWWRAEALLPFAPEAARPWFRRVRETAAVQRDAALAARAWCGQVASYVVQWGDVAGLADLVDDLEALTASLGPLDPALAFRTHAEALTALMYGRAEDPRTPRYAALTEQAIAHAPDDAARISAAAQLLIYRLWWAGDFPGGRALYDSFDHEVSEGEGLPALPRLLWWSCAAIIDWQCGRPEDCYAKVERGLELADSSGVHVRDFFLLTQGIFCALSQEDFARAKGYLGRLARTERTHKRLDTMVHHFFRSWYALSQGDPARAFAHAQSAWTIAQAMGSMFHKVIALSALTPACVAVKDFEGAERAYREQIALAKAAGNPTFSYIAFCGGAELARALGDEERYARQVERILMVKSLGGFHSHCGWRTAMMQDLLAFSLRKGIQPEIAVGWIREKRVPPPPDAPEGWPRPVRIRALAGLDVEVEGAPGEAPGAKSAQKLRELLAVLVAERQGATQADLGDWLWPDGDGDRAAQNLKQAIHRLRQWIGAGAVRVQAQMVRLEPDQVECDVWRAERLPPAEAQRVLHGFDLPPVLAYRTRLARA